jgi:hypothetical protein
MASKGLEDTPAGTTDRFFFPEALYDLTPPDRHPHPHARRPGTWAGRRQALYKRAPSSAAADPPLYSQRREGRF